MYVAGLPCYRKLEEVLVLKQGLLLTMIREANRQQAAAAATSTPAEPAAAPASSRRLKRSPSVAWSSKTLHASSDGFTEAAEVAAAAAAGIESSLEDDERGVHRRQLTSGRQNRLSS